MRYILRYLWIFSIIFLIWQGYSSYSKLPEKMATHSDISGNPDRWSSKRGFFIGWYSLISGMNAMWLLSVLLISWLMRKKLTRTINIPNKEYWMATDERREECAKLVNVMMFGVAFLTNVIWVVIFHAIIQSNIDTRVRINMWAIWATTGLILVFIFVYLLTAFRKPADADSEVQ